MKVSRSTLIVSSVLLVFINLPETTSTTSGSVEDALLKTTRNSPPREFPYDEKNYTFVHNSSIRENLAKNTAKNDTEVDDLLDRDDKEHTPVVPAPVGVVSDVPESSEENVDLFKKNETELIENGENTEDDRVSVEVVKVVENGTRSSSPLSRGQLAGLLAGIFLVMCIGGYAALLSWRRYLEARYGSRQMLVNEDDFNDPNGMKHFSI